MSIRATNECLYGAIRCKCGRKPTEPTGLGAVVIDTDGIAWVRADKDEAPWVSPINWWSAYDDVDAVAILSPGVQL